MRGRRPSGRRPPAWWRAWQLWLKRALGQNIFLCDDCKWNWPSACHRAERPNAVDCPDYARKGR